MKYSTMSARIEAHGPKKEKDMKAAWRALLDSVSHMHAICFLLGVVDSSTKIRARLEPGVLRERV